jgi:hypothetical protein
VDSSPFPFDDELEGKREERAFEWLQSVQGNNDVLAEAASSKFLTGNRRLAAAKAGTELAPENLAANGDLEPQVPMDSCKVIPVGVCSQ